MNGRNEEIYKKNSTGDLLLKKRNEVQTAGHVNADEIQMDSLLRKKGRVN